MQNNMQQTNFKLEKERDLGEIITDTFTFIRVNFEGLKQVFISSILPIMILTVAAGVYYQYASQEITSESFFLSNNPFEILESFTSILLPTLITILTTLFFYVISYLAILGSMKSYQQKGEIDVEFVKTTIKSRFWGMTGLILVSFFMMVFAAALCILPAFYLIVPVSIMFPILVFEDKSLGESIAHAFNLIKENYWITLATIIVIYLIIGLASGIFQIPLMIYTFFSMVTKIEASTVNPENLLEFDWIMLTLTALGNFGSNMLSLVVVISMSLIYYNLNEKHHLTGTVQEIDTIGSN